MKDKVVCAKENIYLRLSTREDCKRFAEWEKDPAVTRFFTIDKDRSYEDVLGEYEGRIDDDTHVQFTICLRESDDMVGRIHISRIDTHYDSLDITRIYIADTGLRGKGYGKEALLCALDYAFLQRGCERVTLDFFTGNEIAASLYRKVGFVEEGVMRHGGKKDGEYVDLHLMSILRDEYFAKR